ncbi:uncharacterized protein [Diadema setosum]|uniref:uncharacterized protein n=1 Tax=Diadema setosum TaxID=31175 RepID=UPI003B3B48C5
MDAQDQTATVTMRQVLVMAKSPLLRIHNVPVFLMHVTECNDSKDHFLLGRGEDASRFHGTTSVGLVYDISGLIPTTVTKGTNIPRKILLLSKSCRLEPCRDDAPELATNGICAQKVTIVNCLDRSLGIYELGNNRRLYLTYQYDGKTSLPVLPVGSEATISNSHKFVQQNEDSSGPTRREDLVCCMRSTVSVHGQVEGMEASKADRVSPGRILLALCAKLHPTLGALEWLRHHMIPVLSQKLLPDIVRLKDLLHVCLKALTTRLANCEEQIMPARSRNLYEEFLSHDTACCISDEQFEPFSFPKISEICDFIDCQLKSGSEKVYTIMQGSWRYSVMQACSIKPQMILVAELCVEGPDNGLFLRDTSGLLPCVILDRGPAKRETDQEGCTNPDHKHPKDLANAQSKLNQCHPHPCLSHLLRIDDFTLIREEEIERGTEEGASSTARDSMTSGSSRVGRKTRPPDYIIFDISQALCLHQGSKVERRDGKRGKRKRSAPSQDKDDENLTSRPSNYETVTIHVLSRRHMLQQPLEGENDRRGQQTPRFFCDILVLKRTEVCNIAGRTRQHGRSDKQLMSESELKWEPAILGFQGDAVRWYHFLRRCQTYQLQSSGPEDTKGAVLSSVRMLSKKGLAQPVYIADSFSQLRVLQNSTVEVCYLCCDGISHSAGKKRPSKRQQTVTSISGLLTKKIVQTTEEVPHTSKCPVPEDPRVLVTLQQAGSLDELSVAIPSWIHHSIIGLIPGAFVTIQNCLCKDFGQGDRIATYEALSVSSIHVDGFSVKSFIEIASPDEEGSATGMGPQRSFLYDIVTRKAGGRGALHATWLYAHVQSIRKFILRWVCRQCERNDCRCPDTTIHNGRLCTQILCSVDDGTGEALVWSDRPQVVRAILDLSARQWDALETSCLGPNRELIFHQPTKQQREDEIPSSSVLTQRLSIEMTRYCQHSCSNIQRSIWLKCRQFRDFSRGQATSDDDRRASSQGLTLCCEEARL